MELLVAVIFGLGMLAWLHSWQNLGDKGGEIDPFVRFMLLGSSLMIMAIGIKVIFNVGIPF